MKTLYDLTHPRTRQPGTPTCPYQPNVTVTSTSHSDSTTTQLGDLVSGGPPKDYKLLIPAYPSAVESDPEPPVCPLEMYKNPSEPYRGTIKVNSKGNYRRKFDAYLF
jgi:hypothetical protein